MKKTYKNLNIPDAENPYTDLGLMEASSEELIYLLEERAAIMQEGETISDQKLLNRFVKAAYRDIQLNYKLTPNFVEFYLNKYVRG